MMPGTNALHNADLLTIFTNDGNHMAAGPAGNGFFTQHINTYADSHAEISSGCPLPGSGYVMECYGWVRCVHDDVSCRPFRRLGNG